VTLLKQVPPPADDRPVSEPDGRNARPPASIPVKTRKGRDMLKALVVRTVDVGSRHKWPVIAIAALITVISTVYAATHFAITTDISKLISADTHWNRQQVKLDQAFPQRTGTIQIVVSAPTPELVGQAADKLTQRLAQQPDLFRAIRQPGAGPFFARNALLFLPPEQLAATTEQLVQAEPLLATLSEDPSLRGVMDSLTFGAMGVQRGQLKLDDVVRPINQLADTVDDVLANRPATFSWRVLVEGRPAQMRELVRFISVQPALDFSALEPGAAASQAIRKAADDLKLKQEFGATVRLTGQVAIADEEFGTLKEGAFINHAATVLSVLFILWLALRSARIITAVFLTLVAGLAITAALGLLMVGAYNMISVAFAVLFVGLGVDFGLQFSVRYRAERHDYDSLPVALRSAAEKAGGPLALAAAATAAGFFSFLPTPYRGLAELGLIAGCGMLVAFITSITLLPALLRVFNPPGEPHELGYSWLAPVDRFLERRRVAVLVTTLLVVLAGSPLLFQLRFDFNPMNLRSARTESVATLLELRKDPDLGVNASEILAPSLADAQAIAVKVAALPEVARTMTLASLVPDRQEEKVAMIRKAAAALTSLDPKETDPPPSDEENASAIQATADSLQKAAGQDQGQGAAAARRLSGLLSRLAKAGPAARERAEAALIPPLRIALNDLRSSLKAEPFALDTLPADLRSDWVTPDGRARVEVTPKGDPNDNEVLRRFAEAVRAVDANAVGEPVMVQESGHLVVRAFFEAGFWALLSITVLLWITLRRFTDVLLTLVPLLLAGVVTLELCVLFGLPLNFANIIALPLLLGVGVAFKIYYIMAWRAGKTSLLQSTLTRAVTCSALTTATAFGSLWLSNHPGTSSMGKLLALSLVCTMAAAVLFQPVLMGPPREAERTS
jgi:uncharacterized protein